MPETATPRAGRPRTKPAGARRRVYYTTDPEHGLIRSAAARAGLSDAEWARRTLLAAAGQKR